MLHRCCVSTIVEKRMKKGQSIKDGKSVKHMHCNQMGCSSRHTRTHRYRYTHIYIYICVCVGVDQKKGIWGSYNRRSTANQSRSQRCQSRESSLVCNTILCRGSSKHCYILQYLETWCEPGPTQAGLTIAEQSRINREPISDFIDLF